MEKSTTEDTFAKSTKFMHPDMSNDSIFGQEISSLRPSPSGLP
ncbi:hypothetical protein CCACVL1_21462 [Corchorus capsularis]|uniref:Uncharacterized protein n=1 Tax=Corchorus capsularis TaxID=210143 RepID=A0A1R3H5M0_COCAP|nr:hypothetical protein CCACVL1_21462 [Corchorus capsularis]